MPEGSRESTRTTEGATGRHLGAGEACKLNGPGRVLITLRLQGHRAQALRGSRMGAAKVKGGQVSPRPVSLDTATGLGSRDHPHFLHLHRLGVPRPLSLLTSSSLVPKVAFRFSDSPEGLGVQSYYAQG